MRAQHPRWARKHRELLRRGALNVVRYKHALGLRPLLALLSWPSLQRVRRPAHLHPQSHALHANANPSRSPRKKVVADPSSPLPRPSSRPPRKPRVPPRSLVPTLPKCLSTPQNPRTATATRSRSMKWSRAITTIAPSSGFTMPASAWLNNQKTNGTAGSALPQLGKVRACAYPPTPSINHQASEKASASSRSLQQIPTPSSRLSRHICVEQSLACNHSQSHTFNMLPISTLLLLRSASPTLTLTSHLWN